MDRSGLALRSECTESSLGKLKRPLIVLAILFTGISVFGGQTAQQFDPNADLKTGPAVGEKIPAFSATDQTGKVRDFDSLKGPQGLVLFFNRSVDW